MLLISANHKIEVQTAAIMGVINLTPDSFYAGSRFPSVQSALEQAGKALRDGADILDLGALSTRPGSEEISADEELARLMPAFSAIRNEFPDAFISVDTYRSSVASEALSMGADMINDVSGGTFDGCMHDVIARYKAPYVLMHTLGKPKTMQDKPVYEDVVTAVKIFFTEGIEKLKQSGIDQIILDPGFGFGKTLEHNYTLLANFQTFRDAGYPVMGGVSRKSMINKVLGTDPVDALNGTSVLHTIALLNGVDILRVHDVREADECRRLINYYNQFRRY